MWRLSICLGLTLVLAGCGSKGKPDSDTPPREATSFNKPANADKASAEDKAALAQGNSAFALALYDQLRNQEGNLFFSPASVSVALAMTYGGARGETAEQMTKALRFPLAPERLHPAFAGLLWDWHGRGEQVSYQLYLANALWAQHDYELVPDHLDLLRDNYGTAPQTVDVERKPEEARATINAWVEKNTREKIKDVVPPNFLNADTRLILVNAVYFKGLWERPFDKSATRPWTFYVTAGRTVEVPFMFQTQRFSCLNRDTFQMLEMPYQGSDWAMVVLLPRKRDGLAELEKSLTAEQLTRWMGEMRTHEMDVALPKFNLTGNFSLKPVLRTLGMPLAFDEKADFSGVSPRRPLFVIDVMHKAFVEVNEEGSEGAAGTVVARDKGGPGPDGKFRANHPFLFMIRHRQNGSILFLGRVTDPRG